MQARSLSRDEVPQAVAEEIAAARQHPPFSVDGEYVAVVVVGRVSPRRYHVGWHYQPRTHRVGDSVRVTHPEIFLEPPVIHWMAA